MKILKWQHKIVRGYRQGKLVSYYLSNAAKTCVYGLKTSENTEIEHVFQSKAFFHRSGNLHTSCFSTFNDDSMFDTTDKLESTLSNYGGHTTNNDGCMY